ncbi:MAG: peptidase S14 [Pseudomonadota bacterium]
MLSDFDGRELLFLGKQAASSAGATFMSYFPREPQFLTRQPRLMIHERQMVSTIDLDGPLRSCATLLRANLYEIEQSIEIKDERFAAIADQPGMSIDRIREHAPENWYIDAEEAKTLGLALDVD